jgi:hypothetical protein
MTPIDLPHLRLHNQHIAYQQFKTPAAVVGWMGALQAQDYSGAKWSIGLRLPGSTDAQIEQAIANQHILRTWVMRGTLHFVAAEDIRWMVTLLAPGLIQSNARRYKQLELDAKTLAGSTDIITSAVQDKPLTRKQLFEVLEEKGISPSEQRGVYMLQRASLDGLICQTVMQGNNNPTFIPMPKVKSLPKDEASAELAQRYFTSHGPATLKDFAWWSGLTAADARTGFEAVKSKLVELKIDGQSYGHTETNAPSKPSVYLLPGFDEYILGYQDRSVVLDTKNTNKIFPGGGTFHPAIVADGQVVGRWQSAVKKGAIIITPSLFGEAEPDALEAATQAYSAFMGMSVVVKS